MKLLGVSAISLLIGVFIGVAYITNTSGKFAMYQFSLLNDVAQQEFTNGASLSSMYGNSALLGMYDEVRHTSHWHSDTVKRIFLQSHLRAALANAADRLESERMRAEAAQIRKCQTRSCLSRPSMTDSLSLDKAGNDKPARHGIDSDACDFRRHVM